MTTKQEAAKEISAKIKQVETLIKEAEALADEHGLEFGLYTSYGMGGTYIGRGADDDWAESDEYDREGRWVSSSENC